MRVAVICIVKNEVSSLLEWLAWHRVQGVSHFFIVDNYSNDGTWQLLSQLAKNTDWLSCFRIPTLGNRPPQMHAYRRVLPLAAKKADIVAIIDADEYVMPTHDSSVVSLCSAWFADDDVGAVALNWACFGSAEQVFVEDGFVFERFCQRFAPHRLHNLHYKTLFRPECVSRLVSPHQVALKKGRYINSDGEVLVDHPKHTKGLSQQMDWSKARVNHYVVKSLEEFLVRKSTVGSAASTSKRKHQTYFTKHNHNDEFDDSALRYLPQVKAEYLQLKQLSTKPDASNIYHDVVSRCRLLTLKFQDLFWALRIRLADLLRK